MTQSNPKTDHSVSPSSAQDESDLSQADLAAEFHAWDVASDEALENFEVGLAISCNPEGME